MNNLNVPPQTGTQISVTIVSSQDGRLWLKKLSLPSGVTIAQSLISSGFLSEFTGTPLESISVGVFGKHLPIHHRLEDNDRVEIYAPLRVDPKTARRRRAAHREKARNIKKKMPVNDLTQ